MKKIKIVSPKYGTFYALVDDDDYDWLKTFRWNVMLPKNSSTVYARHYCNGKNNYMHVMIMGKKKGHELDHIDRNGLNNQRSNLRFVSHHKNSFNKHYKRVSKNGYKGVMFDTKVIARPFRARLMKKGKAYYGGNHSTAKEAAISYNKLVLEHHGDMGTLNIIR